jgi:hypothetical protein
MHVKLVKTTLRFFRRSETSVCNYSVTHRRVGSMNYNYELYIICKSNSIVLFALRGRGFGDNLN